jgi:hypothetical protein
MQINELFFTFGIFYFVIAIIYIFFKIKKTKDEQHTNKIFNKYFDTLDHYRKSEYENLNLIKTLQEQCLKKNKRNQ